jgi:cytochrome c-type biogenesis protein CcmH/NrfF
LLATLSAGTGRADDDPEIARARAAHELAGELMSPYCPGRTLAECPSPDAGAVRDEIRAALRAGEPVESIRARIEARFGSAVVAMPRSTLGLALPILFLALGAVVLAVVLRRALARPAPGKAIPTEVAARLERELRDVER